MFQRYLADRSADLPTFSPARGFWANRISQSAADCDVLHFHWVAFLFDYPSFFRSLGARPIVWTLHDMNPFTGGCHYSNGCQRFGQGCGRCPLLDQPSQEDISAFSWNHKQQALRGLSIDVVAPSQWLLQAAKNSGIFSSRTRWHHLNYGIDNQSYSPLNKRKAKQLLGLNPDTPVILFAADNLKDQRKGASRLWEALGKVPGILNFQMMTFGHGAARELPGRRAPLDLGFLETDRQKSVAYSAADIFVLPSLEDNQPQTGLEAMACETPVVAFRAGGIPEFVVEGGTGLLADTGDSMQFSERICQLLENESLRTRLGKAARKKMINEFDISRQTQSYLDIYQAAAQQSRGRIWRRAG